MTRRRPHPKRRAGDGWIPALSGDKSCRRRNGGENSLKQIVMSNARAFALAGFKCAFTPLLSQFRLQWATPKSGCDRIAITLLQHFCICHAGPTLTTFFAKFVAQKQARAGRIIRLGFYFGMRAGRGRKGVNSTMLLMTKFFPISQMRQIGFGPHPQPFGDPRLRHRGLRPPPLRAGDLPRIAFAPGGQRGCRPFSPR